MQDAVFSVDSVCCPGQEFSGRFLAHDIAMAVLVCEKIGGIRLAIAELACYQSSVLWMGCNSGITILTCFTLIGGTISGTLSCTYFVKLSRSIGCLMGPAMIGQSTLRRLHCHELVVNMKLGTSASRRNASAQHLWGPQTAIQWCHCPPVIEEQTEVLSHYT